jgi:hypothetical protein
VLVLFGSNMSQGQWMFYVSIAQSDVIDSGITLDPIISNLSTNTGTSYAHAIAVS